MNKEDENYVESICAKKRNKIRAEKQQTKAQIKRLKMTNKEIIERRNEIRKWIEEA